MNPLEIAERDRDRWKAKFHAAQADVREVLKSIQDVREDDCVPTDSIPFLRVAVMFLSTRAKLAESKIVKLENGVMHLQPVLVALADCEISTGRARDCIREWLGGATTFRLPEQDPSNDELRKANAALSASEEEVRVLRKKAREVLESAYKVQDWEGTRLGDALESMNDSISENDTP